MKKGKKREIKKVKEIDRKKKKARAQLNNNFFFCTHHTQHTQSHALLLGGFIKVGKVVFFILFELLIEFSSNQHASNFTSSCSNFV